MLCLFINPIYFFALRRNIKSKITVKTTLLLVIFLKNSLISLIPGKTLFLELQHYSAHELVICILNFWMVLLNKLGAMFILETLLSFNCVICSGVCRGRKKARNQSEKFPLYLVRSNVDMLLMEHSQMLIVHFIPYTNTITDKITQLIICTVVCVSCVRNSFRFQPVGMQLGPEEFITD